MISTAHAPRLAARIGQSTFVIRSETPLPKTRCAGPCRPSWTRANTADGPRRQRPAPAHPPGGQHRPQREPEPGAVGAGRRDAQAQGL